MTTRDQLLSSVFDDKQISGLVACVKEIAPGKSTEGQLLDFFRSCDLKITDEEIDEAAAYFSSPIGKKDQELAMTMSNQFADLDEVQRKKVRSSNRVSTPKLERLIEIYGMGSICGTTTENHNLTSEIENILAMTYSSLSETELEELLAFYDSPVGRKCAEATRNAGAAILSHSKSNNFKDGALK